MKKISAIIVEDILNEATFLSDSLNRLFPEIEIMAIADTVEKAKISIERYKPQLTFFDVELGSKNSFEILNGQYIHPFKIIFVTAHSGYMLDAIRVSAADYILKPYSQEDLIRAVRRAIEIIANESLQELSGKIDVLYRNLSEKSAKNKILPLINKDGQHRIVVSDILFCRTTKEETKDGNISVRIQFRLINGESIIVSNTSITHFEGILSPYDFARVSQPYLINMNHLKIYQKKGGKIIMKGYPMDGKIIEEDIYISDAKKNWFDKRYNDFSDMLR